MEPVTNEPVCTRNYSCNGLDLARFPISSWQGLQGHTLDLWQAIQREDDDHTREPKSDGQRKEDLPEISGRKAVVDEKTGLKIERASKAENSPPDGLCLRDRGYLLR